jgi:putative ABC transport system permease protein
VLACTGGLTGLVLGHWALRGVLPLFAESLPTALSIDVDGRAALFTAGLTAAIAGVFGVIAAHRPGDRLAESLGSATRSITATGRSRSALVVAQIALAVVLLSAAGLMLDSVARLSRVKPGFDPDHVLTFKVALTGSRYTAKPVRVGFVSDLLERLTATAGVRAAGLTSLVPFGGMRGANTVEIEGRTPVPGEPALIIDQRHVSPGYFQTMRIPLVSGRALKAADDDRAERVTVINRTMAQRYFQNTDPVNRRVRTSAGFDSGVWFRIVGVVDDVRHISLSRDPVPEMYHPIAQTAVPTFTVVARTAGDPAAMAPAVRAAVQAVDANLPIYDVRTMDDRIASSFAQTRATTLLLMVTAALAAALASVAIYGAIWHSVVQRTPELGIRLALGASRGSVFRRVVAGAVVLASVGAALGTVTSIAAGSLLRNLLFDTRTTDPLTYAAVIGGVIALTIAASIVPALRAMRVDPFIALRN